MKQPPSLTTHCFLSYLPNLRSKAFCVFYMVWPCKKRQVHSDGTYFLLFNAFSWRRQPFFVISFLLPSYMKYLQCSRVLNILHVTQLQSKIVKSTIVTWRIFKTLLHCKYYDILKDLRQLDIEISVDSFSLRSIKRGISVFSLHTKTATLRR